MVGQCTFWGSKDFREKERKNGRESGHGQEDKGKVNEICCWMEREELSTRLISPIVLFLLFLLFQEYIWLFTLMETEMVQRFI